MKKSHIALLFLSLFSGMIFSQKIVGYIPQYRTIAQMDASIEWGSMTEAYYFGSKPTSSGGITIEQPNRFQHVLDKSLQYGLNPWLCVGGWGKSQDFITVARNATARQSFADEALRLCQLHGLTGIDIDWEFPAAGQETDFRNFLKTLYETLHPAGYKVSAACGGEDLHAVKWTGDIFNYIDDLNIMSYDAPTSVSSNHASLQFMKDAMDIYHAKGCPYEKMLGGLAFYSRPTVKMYSEVINQSTNKQSTFDNDGTGSVKYNGKNTIEDKIDYVMGKGGLGVLIWEVTQDIKGNYSLLNVCDEVMEEYRCPLPKPNLGEAQSICGSPYVTLDAGVTGNISYKWYDANGIIAGASSKTFNAPSAGEYEVEVTDGTCSNFAKVEVLGILPDVDLGADINLCSPATATLDVGLTGSGINFSWKKNNQTIAGANSKDLLIETAGEYEITITASGCGSKTDNVNVTSSLLNVESGSGCAGDDITVSVLDNNGPYEWFTDLNQPAIQDGQTYTAQYSGNTTVYVRKKETFSEQIVGPSANTFTSLTTVDYNNRQYLKLESEMSVNSVKIKTGNTGAWVTLYLQNENGIIAQKEFNKPGSSSQLTWDINTTLSAGTYFLSAQFYVGQAKFNTTAGDQTIPSVVTLEAEKTYQKVPTGKYGMFYALNVTAGYKNVCEKTPVTISIDPSCNTSPDPTISVVANKNNVCADEEITFTAATTDADGETLVWKVNGNTVQTSTSKTYKSSVLANNDNVTVELQSDASIKDNVTAKVTAKVTPTVAISADKNNVCEGEEISFSKSITNEGANPQYSWRVNGAEVSTTANYKSSNLNDRDKVSLKLTSSVACVTNDEVTSSDVVMAIESLYIIENLEIYVDANDVCEGVEQTFSVAIPIGVNFDWQVNGKSIGETSGEFKTSSMSNGDRVSLEVVANQPGICADLSPVMSNEIISKINTKATPTLEISADKNTICDNEEVTFTAVAKNDNGATINWYVNDVSVGATGGEYKTTSLSNNDQVHAYMQVGGSCLTTNTITSNKETINVGAPVTPTVVIKADKSTVCEGEEVTYSIESSAHLGNNPMYQWRNVFGAPLGTEATLKLTSNYGLVSLKVTSSESCVSSNIVYSNTTQNITVNPVVTSSVSVVVSETEICEGESVIFTATPVNGGTPAYQWLVNGNNVGSNQVTYSSSTLSSSDNVSVKMTSSETCASPSDVVSNDESVIVNKKQTPLLSIVADKNTICDNEEVIFTATKTNDFGADVKWSVNNVLTGASGDVFKTSSLSNNDKVTATISVVGTCLTSNNVTSNEEIISVGAPVTPSVSISAIQNNVCEGEKIDFSKVVGNEGNAPAYSWKVNGNEVSSSLNFSSITLINGDQVTLTMTSSLGCVTTSEVTSLPVVMNLTSATTSAVSIVASATEICEGESVKFTATPINGGTPDYEWMISGNTVGSNQATYTTSSLVDGQNVAVKMTTSLLCSTGDVTSNELPVKVNSKVTPTISISADKLSICKGDDVKLTAVTSNDFGATVNWLVNNQLESTGAVLNISSLSSEDEVKATIQVVGSCVSTNSVSSTGIEVEVNDLVTPEVSISSPKTTVCQGEEVTVLATTNSAASVSSYEWTVSGTKTTTSDNRYTFAPNDGETVEVKIAVGNGCYSSNEAVSNPLGFNVNSLVSPTVQIALDENNLCEGESFEFNASVTGEGNNPQYTWSVNGAEVANGASFSSSNLNDGDKVELMLSSAASCTSVADVTSQPVTVVVKESVQSSQSIPNQELETGFASYSIDISNVFTNATSVTLTGNGVVDAQLSGDQVLVSDNGAIGQSVFVLTASDECGQSVTENIEFNVVEEQIENPIVSIKSPSSDVTLEEEEVLTVEFEVSVGSASISKVEVYIRDKTTGDIVAVVPVSENGGSYTGEWVAMEGDYELEIGVETDRGGNTTKTSNVTVTAKEIGIAFVGLSNGEDILAPNDFTFEVELSNQGDKEVEKTRFILENDSDEFLPLDTKQGELELVHLLSTRGEYTVYAIVYFTDGTDKVSSKMNFTVTNTTSMSAIAGVEKFLVAPNPFSDALNIELNSTVEGSIYVYDVLGQLKETVSFSKLKEGRLSLNTTSWSEGMYLVSVSTSNGNQTVKVKK